MSNNEKEKEKNLETEQDGRRSRYGMEQRRFDGREELPDALQDP